VETPLRPWPVRNTNALDRRDELSLHARVNFGSSKDQYIGGKRSTLRDAVEKTCCD